MALRPSALLVLAAAELLPCTALGEPTKWRIDGDHSTVSVVTRYLLITPLRARFSRIDGVIVLDEENLEASSVQATIDSRSLSTGHQHHDERLRSREFFWPAKYPRIEFRSTKIQRAQGDKLFVTGLLTIRGIEREVTLEVKGPTHVVNDENGKPCRAATGRVRIDRKDFGMIWNQALDGGGVVIGDEAEVEITLTLRSVPERAKAEARP